MKQLKLIIVILFLSIEQVFAQCAGIETSNLSPQPTNGTYPPGTTVNFCYTMQGYFQSGANWIDGFEINLGAGWDMSTLVPLLGPGSCAGDGQWGFYNSVTSSNTGQIFGPGFFYDHFPLDGNPGNDYGDYTATGTCQWHLCFNITTAQNCTGQDLSVSITAIGDGTVGSWINQSCPGVPFQLVAATCNQICNMVITYQTTNVTCYNSCNGNINIFVAGGTAPYINIWSSGNGSNLCAGTYSVTTTDAAGCSFDTTITIIQPDSLYAVLVYDSLLCNGDNNAQAYIDTIIGGTPPYSILWSNNSNNASIGSLGGGNYNVSIIDANGCSWFSWFTIFEPQPLISDISQANESCPLANNGWVSVNVNGGIMPYSYSWGPTNTISNLDTGTYYVTIIDNNGCSIEDSGIVMSNPLLSVDVCCYDTITNGESIILTGSVYPFFVTHIWSTGQTGGNHILVSPTVTTTYYLWVNDGNGCINMDSVIIVVLPTSYFYIPNAFTPNNDGYNDLFYPIIGDAVRIERFEIYDRWGEQVFDAIGNNSWKWNGTYHEQPCQIGVYVYYIRYSIYDKTYSKKGDVTLIR